MLISSYTDINMTDRNGNTLIALCLLKNHHELAHELIKYGAKLDVQSAVVLGEIGFIDKMVSVKGVNFKFWKGRNILHLGIENNNEKVVKWILERGASLDETNGIGETPLLLACKFGNIKIINLLFSVPNKKNSDIVNEVHHGCSPLWTAIIYGWKEVIKVLIKNNADVNFVYNNRSCLYESIRKNDTEVVKMLLEKNANPNFKSNMNHTPLHEAVRKNNLEMTRLLLKARASVLVFDEDDNTPLHIASGTGNEKMVRLVLQSLMDVKNKNSERAVDLLPQDGDMTELKSLLIPFGEI